MSAGLLVGVALLLMLGGRLVIDRKCWRFASQQQLAATMACCPSLLILCRSQHKALLHAAAAERKRQRRAPLHSTRGSKLSWTALAGATSAACLTTSRTSSLWQQTQQGGGMSCGSHCRPPIPPHRRRPPPTCPLRLSRAGRRAAAWQMCCSSLRRHLRCTSWRGTAWTTWIGMLG